MHATISDSVIVFDANETLLDLAGLDETFGRIFGDATVRHLWFSQLLQLFLTATVIDVYEPFDVLGQAALTMVAEQQGVVLTDADRQRVASGLRGLPAHADVRPALERLQRAGVRLAVLTNSPLAVAREQAAHAGIAEFFEVILSADSVQRYKPAPEAYRHAADELRVPMSAMTLVAAHSWDVAGAMAAGCQATFVARPGRVLNPRGTAPAMRGRTLTEIADLILARRATVS